MRTIAIDTKDHITTVTLNRPDVRNAFNEVVIAELTEAFRSIPPEIRVVILQGAGALFCAGADVDWMKQSRTHTEAQNREDAQRMSAMFRAIDECPKAVIGRVHGLALGGGSGLTACCDMVLAAEGTQFGFTEVRLGIVPAVISAYVLPKIGAAHARRYFLTGERFGTEAALRMGLIHEVAPVDQLDARVANLAAQILECGPSAVSIAKQLVRDVLPRSRGEAVRHTVETIARVRVTPEAQEGLGAFLEKRKPQWP